MEGTNPFPIKSYDTKVQFIETLVIMKNTKKKSTKELLEKEWKNSTLEKLEKDVWGEPTYDSYLVTTCHALRKKELQDFTIEDLRIMIGQSIGLKYLIPLAIKELSADIFAQGDMYQGDLLKAVLTSDSGYWKSELKNWKMVCELFNRNKELLQSFDTTRSIKDGWFKAFEEFEKISS